MFKDDYRNQLDNIKPDGFIKHKIRSKIEIKEEPIKIPPRFSFGKAVALALSLVLVFTVGTVIGRKTAPAISTHTVRVMKTADDYDKIYSKLSDFKLSFWEKFTNGINVDKGVDDYLYFEEEAATTDTAKPGAGANKGNMNGSSSDTATDANGNSHSETTTQTLGVDEADIVKTDGRYIYIMSHSVTGKIKIVEAGDSLKQLDTISIGEDLRPRDMYLNGDRLVVLCYKNIKSQVAALIYDVSDPQNPKLLETCTQSGGLNTSRLIGNKLYIVSNYRVNVTNMVKSDTESYMPYIKCGGYDDTVEPNSVHFYDDCNSPEYTVISAYNIKDGTLISTQSILGGTQTVYMSTENIIIADNGWEETQIARFSVLDGKIELKASSKIDGRLLNQFSIDEYNGYFRFVLTGEKEKLSSNDTYSYKENITVNSLVILNDELKETGKITDLAPDERVYSVRFMGNMAYFVTFRETDPLFSVDVSDPKNPKVLSALKIPGFSNYLFPYGEGKLLGIGENADQNGRTTNMKLSMFNIKDPKNVTESDMTDIPALYSEALSNHKAVLCDYNRNIIAFSAQGYYSPFSYFVYSYENGKFIQKLQVKLDMGTATCRGIYIGKTFYIVTDREIYCYDMANFEQLNTLKLN